ncbi:MAG: glycosyltransferase [Bacteroidales bacterium]
MKRALLIANFNSFHRQFNLPYIKRLSEKGYQVSLVSAGGNEFDDIEEKYNIAFDRTPYKLKNIKSFFKLRSVFSTYYDVIYISTSVIGAFGRLALLGKKHGRVIYSAHGYNFYKVNGKIVGKIYLPIEKFLSKICDCIFTMNQEDYETTIEYNFPCKEIYNVDGVGIDTKRFGKPTVEEKNTLRKQHGYSEDTFILFYAAELTERKNQRILFDVLQELIKKHKNVKLLLAGAGTETESYKTIVAEKGLNEYIEFLGFRCDVSTLLKLSDVLFASSLNEGLPINMIEGLATGLPVVATAVRGHVDLIENGRNGYLFDIDSPVMASDSICKLIEDKLLYDRFSEQALVSSQMYDINVVIHQYDKIFGI